MKTKGILAVVAALMLVLPAAASAAEYYGPNQVQVIEGHTVFTVIDIDEQVVEDEEAAAVAVLVREAEREAKNFPGVLWFNDQYLVPPENVNKEQKRYPCGGAVVAWNTADSAVLYPEMFKDTPPTTVMDSDYPTDANGWGSGKTAEYVESYRVTDPNDNTWIIDKYNVHVPMEYQATQYVEPAGGATYPVWVVNIGGENVQNGHEPGFQSDDTSTSCGPFEDNPPAGYYEPTEVDDPTAPTGDPITTSPDSYCYDGGVYTGANPAGTTCNDASGARPATHKFREYNALLFFFLGEEDVTVTGTKAHAQDDTNGCWAGTEWECPNNDNTKQGNSHPFNPRSVPNADRTCSYGTSPDPVTKRCPDGEHAQHNTGNVDVFFLRDYRPDEPLFRNFRVQDDVGSGEKFYGLADDHQQP